MDNSQALLQLATCYEDYIKQLEQVKKRIKPLDGKIFNKKVRDAINSVDSIYFSQDRELITNINHNIFTCYVSEYTDGKRFNSEKFSTQIDEYIKDKQEYITKLRQEAAAGETIIKIYNSLIDKIEDLMRDVSPDFKQYNRYEFKPLIYGNVR